MNISPIDIAADSELAGENPGNIFEFHVGRLPDRVRFEGYVGGLVVTTGAEGSLPRNPHKVSKLVLVRKDGSTRTLRGASNEAVRLFNHYREHLT